MHFLQPLHGVAPLKPFQVLVTPTCQFQRSSVPAQACPPAPMHVVAPRGRPLPCQATMWSAHVPSQCFHPSAQHRVCCNHSDLRSQPSKLYPPRCAQVADLVASLTCRGLMEAIVFLGFLCHGTGSTWGSCFPHFLQVSLVHPQPSLRRAWLLSPCLCSDVDRLRRLFARNRGHVFLKPVFEGFSMIVVLVMTRWFSKSVSTDDTVVKMFQRLSHEIVSFQSALFRFDFRIPHNHCALAQTQGVFV